LSPDPEALWSRLGRVVSRTQPAWLAALAAVGLSAVGIAAIGTTPRESWEPAWAAKQSIWLGLALVVMAVALIPHPRRLAEWAVPLAIFATALLVLLILPGVPQWLVPVRNGARAWINLRFMMFQPSELAKVAFVLVMAEFLRRGASHRTVRGLLWPFLMTALPVVLLLMEPDLGTALLFPPTLLAMLIAAGAKLRHLSAVFGLGLAVIVVNVAVVFFAPDDMQLLKSHQRDRIKAIAAQWAGETKYQNTTGYQQHKAVTLIGAGGWTGYGAERSRTLLRYNALPEDHNDMVFVVIVNRWGLLGGLMTLGLFAILLGGYLTVAARSRDPFVRLATVGLASVLSMQVFINVGVTLGLLPVTGITLPFVSYGGSSLLAAYGTLGLVLNFASRPARKMQRPSFEFEAAEDPGMLRLTRPSG